MSAARFFLQDGMHVIRAGGATLQNPPVFVDRKAAKGSKSVLSNSVTLKKTEHSNLPLTIPILHEMVCRNHPQLKVSGIGFECTIFQAPRARDCLWEVEALLDHLFEHPNTPVFVAYRMIQRFVTSNPSGAYVQAVSDAFKTGRVLADKYLINSNHITSYHTIADHTIAHRFTSHQITSNHIA